MANSEVMIAELRTIHAKVDNLMARRPKRNIVLPQGVQKAVLAVVKKMDENEEHCFKLTYEKFQDNDVEMVVNETKKIYHDQNWSCPCIAEAFKRVWRNLRDEKNRRLTGKMEKHRHHAKLNKRIRDKLERRTRALHLTNWSEEEKERMKEVLKKDFTSPEKDVSGERVKCPFSWESTKLRKRKQSLDETYKQSLNEKAKRQLFLPVIGDACDVPPPLGAPSWTISKRANLD